MMLRLSSRLNLRCSPARSLVSSPSLGWSRSFSSVLPITHDGLYVDHTLPRTFDKVLIANRGEIALRVMRTCKHLGIKTVAVFSEVDQDSMHVRMADEAYLIGPPPANESYLVGQKIIDVAKASGAQAIHPGYGFLSENASFASLCEDNGIAWVGPPSSAIEDMGSKSASKRIMINANVPVVPGYHGDNQDIEVLRKEAENIGYPIMIKAVLGGGGKGMRIVEKAEDFDEKLDACKRESLKSFSDDRVLLEKFVSNPRHVEFQVFADKEGNAVHFWERDCSVQRRHQKVLEEAPAPGMTSELRARMGKAATDAAKAVGYRGAGTVEFIVDKGTDNFYFMEMNTRLQVEHPVTEMIMGRDLVQWQLVVAKGHSLPLDQKTIEETTKGGHSVEARIYAENPSKGFLPCTGSLDFVSTPENNNNVRVETGVREGDDISIYYDPMIAKLVVWGNDRNEALDRLDSCLSEYNIVGLPTNIQFVRACASHKSFREGQVTTAFIDENKDDVFPTSSNLPVPTSAHSVPLSFAIASILMEEQNAADEANEDDLDEYSPWNTLSNFRMNAPSERNVSIKRLFYENEEESHVDIAVKVIYSKNISCEEYCCYEYIFELPNGDIMNVIINDVDETNYSMTINGETHNARVVSMDNSDDIDVFMKKENNGIFDQSAAHMQFRVTHIAYGDNASDHHAGAIAPMSGKIVKVLTQVNAVVKKGTPLVIMEAMKMEHIVKAGQDGTIESIHFKEGDFVNGGETIVSFPDVE